MSSSWATSSAFQRSTSRRISTARCRGGRCCSAATKASRIDSFATARSAGSASSGSTCRSSTGSTHAVPGPARRQRVLDRLPRRAGQVHRQRAALPAGQLVEADVGGDPVQPRPQRRPALEVRQPAPGAHHRLLHRVLGVEGRAEHPVAVAGQLAAVLEQPRVELVGRADRHAGHWGPLLRSRCVRSAHHRTTDSSGAPVRPVGTGTGHRGGRARASTTEMSSSRQVGQARLPIDQPAGWVRTPPASQARRHDHRHRSCSRP